MAYIGLVTRDDAFAQMVKAALDTHPWCRETSRAQLQTALTLAVHQRAYGWPTVDVVIIEMPAAKSLKSSLREFRGLFPNALIVTIPRAGKRFEISLDSEKIITVAERDIPTKLADTIQTWVLATRDRPRAVQPPR